MKMSNFNESASNLTLGLIDQNTPMKASLIVTPSIVFLYVNGVMIFTLRKKAVFQEMSRYILFGHMLWVDTLSLIFSLSVYICAVCRFLIIRNICLLLLVSAKALFHVSILNLSLMSLERYVAICFPLRHAEFTSFKITHTAIVVVWVLGLIQCLSEVIIFYSFDSANTVLNSFCTRIILFRLQIYKSIDIAFTCIFFVLVSFVIIFTYASIAAVAKTAACDKLSAKKANKTVLLHLIQLGLGAMSILVGVVQEAIYLSTNYLTAINVMYFCFVVFIVFPKCLSPLIYGMRDQAFCCLFKYYFTFGKGKVKPVLIELHV
uniref:Odorant receptor n=1 Tax=Danio rerio TaxID=7955 RepID=Q2PR90_DANRE|nr:olfactory receptor 2A1/2A42-like [Danio rerio]ABC43377.1 odorant receptor [Danio rerio]|eukprot:XP_017208427.1 olfactory receptor 2A1/2A42-like [Danio rerio]